MANRKQATQEELRHISQLVGLIEQRVSTPRGNRWKRYQRAFREWVEQNPAVNGRDNFPNEEQYLFTYDRDGDQLFGLFWNNRLLRLARTVWRSPGAAITEFNNYVVRLLHILRSEAHPLYTQELQDFTRPKMREVAKKITKSLQSMGILQVRELDVIPMPPDEE